MENNAHETDAELGLSVTVTTTPSAIDSILELQSETEAFGETGVQEIDPDDNGFETVLGRSYN